ncbi:glutathione S-transferase, partial [Mycena albidolilacea]
DDNGFILYESRAICRYIAAKYPESNLIPTDPKKNALFEQAASSEYANFETIAGGIIMEVWGKRTMGLKEDQAVIDAKTLALDAKLNAYNAILGKTKYLAGDEITLADLFHLPHAPIIEEHAKTDIMVRKPNVARSSLQPIPAFQKFPPAVGLHVIYAPGGTKTSSRARPGGRSRTG